MDFHQKYFSWKWTVSNKDYSPSPKNTKIKANRPIACYSNEK